MLDMVGPPFLGFVHSLTPLIPVTIVSDVSQSTWTEMILVLQSLWRLTLSRIRSVDFNTMTKYLKNSLKVDSAEMRKICSCAEDNNIAVVLGFSENLNNSLYIAQATISNKGELTMDRRKLKATHLERTVFGDAGGSSLHNVISLGLGEQGGVERKVGALSCWEHIQPLLKYHTYLQGEEIHVAAWPPLEPHPGGDALWGMSKEGETLASNGSALLLKKSF